MSMLSLQAAPSALMVLAVRHCGIGPSAGPALGAMLSARATQLCVLDLGDNPLKHEVSWAA
jgi:hypothetical protein